MITRKETPPSLFRYSNTDAIFIIPIYQRAYVWTPLNQIDALFADVMGYLEDTSKKHPHFMGTVLLDKSNDRNSDQIYYIVDGQQRLTTFALICAVALDIKKNNLKKSKNENNLENCLFFNKKIDTLEKILHIEEQSQTRLRYLEDGKNKKENKLLQSILSLNFKEYIENKNSYGKDEVKNTNLYKAFFYIYEKLNKLVAENKERFQSFVDLVLERLEFIVIELDEQDQNSLEIFENINSKKESLKTHEVITNYLYMQVSPPLTHEDIYLTYLRAIEETLSPEEKEEFFFDYLRMWAYSLKSIPTKESLYKSFKEVYHKVFARSLEDFLKSLVRFSLAYKNLRSIIQESNEYKSPTHSLFPLYALQKLGLTSTNPLMLYLYGEYLQCKKEYNEEPTKELAEKQKIYIEFLQILLNIMLRSKLCGISIQKKMDEFNIDVIKHLQSGKGPSDQDYAKNIVSIYPSADTLKSAIEDSPILNDDLAKILLLMCEQSLRDMAPIQDTEITSISNLHLEHIMPKNIEKWEKDGYKNISEYKSEFLNLLGNLTLLSVSLNTEIKNDIFSKKIIKYKESSGLLLNKEYLLSKGFTKFDTDAIKERTKQLAELVDLALPAKFPDAYAKNFSKKVSVKRWSSTQKKTVGITNKKLRTSTRVLSLTKEEFVKWIILEILHTHPGQEERPLNVLKDYKLITESPPEENKNYCTSKISIHDLLYYCDITRNSISPGIESLYLQYPESWTEFKEILTGILYSLEVPADFLEVN